MLALTQFPWYAANAGMDPLGVISFCKDLAVMVKHGIDRVADNRASCEELRSRVCSIASLLNNPRMGAVARQCRDTVQDMHRALDSAHRLVESSLGIFFC